MPRFTLPLLVDFSTRVDTTNLAKATYIQNGYVKTDITPKVYNRTGIKESMGQGTNIHIIASCPYSPGTGFVTGIAFVGYESTLGHTGFYLVDGSGGAPVLKQVLATALTYYGADIVPVVNAASGLKQDYWVRLHTISGGTGNTTWRIAPDVSVTVIDSDPDYPGVFATGYAGTAYLDKYVFVLASQGAARPAIWNSDLDDLTSWNALGYIAVELREGLGVGIETYKNHVVFFGTRNIQFFYNAGQPAPGSPLRPRQDLVYNFGLHSNTLLGAKSWWKSTKGDVLAFIGSTLDRKKFIGLFNDFAAERISNDFIDGILEQYNSISITGYSNYGKQFIHVCIGGQLSLYYDIDTKLWHVFNSSIPNLAANPYLVNSVFPANVGGTSLLSYAPGSASPSAPHGRSYRFDDSINARQDTDNNSVTTPINLIIQTSRYRGEPDYRAQRKFHHELQVIGDTLPGADTISVQYSDDDYQTFSAARTIDMTQSKKQLQKLGYFRERAFKLTYSGTQQVRLEAVEGQVQTGTN